MLKVTLKGYLTRFVERQVFESKLEGCRRWTSFEMDGFNELEIIEA